MMNNSNCLNQWFLTGSARIPRGVNKFPGGVSPCVNFVNRKLFHPNYFFKVMGDLKQRTITQWMCGREKLEPRVEIE